MSVTHRKHLIKQTSLNFARCMWIKTEFTNVVYNISILLNLPHRGNYKASVWLKVVTKNQNHILTSCFIPQAVYFTTTNMCRSKREQSKKINILSQINWQKQNFNAFNSVSKINERINCKLLLLSLAYSSQHHTTFLSVSCLFSLSQHLFINCCHHCLTTLSLSLKITNCPFRFDSPHICNQLSVSFRQSASHSPHFTHGCSLSLSFLPSLILSLFHSRLKT